MRKIKKKVLYATKLVYSDTLGPRVQIWHGMERDEKTYDYTFVQEMQADLATLFSLKYKKYQDLVEGNKWVYMNLREVNYMLERHGLGKLKPPICQTCSPTTRGYVALMSFYTGCPDCNSDDKGRYTLFELQNK